MRGQSASQNLGEAGEEEEVRERELTDNAVAVTAAYWGSPRRNIGGKVGAAVGVHELGGAGDVLPLSRRRAT